MKLYYNLNGSCVESIDYSYPLLSPVYDKVVDRSTFVPDSETTRIKAISGAGSVANPLYDKEEPTKLEIALRSGKLDKAEVQKIQDGLAKDTKESMEKLNKDLKKEKSSRVEKERQKAVDSVLGFDSSNVK